MAAKIRQRCDEDCWEVRALMNVARSRVAVSNGQVFLRLARRRPLRHKKTELVIGHSGPVYPSGILFNRFLGTDTGALRTTHAMYGAPGPALMWLLTATTRVCPYRTRCAPYALVKKSRITANHRATLAHMPTRRLRYLSYTAHNLR